MNQSLEKDKSRKKELEIKVKDLEKEQEALIADIKSLKGIF
jgi:hypothetical protein